MRIYNLEIGSLTISFTDTAKLLDFISAAEAGFKHNYINNAADDFRKKLVPFSDTIKIEVVQEEEKVNAWRDENEAA